MKTIKIAIDAGHYLYTSGKRCLKSIDPEETREWVLNSRVASMLVSRLAEYENLEILRVDDVSGEKEVTLAERCKKANDFEADLYLSIHHNAGINGGSGGGTVVFYYSPDPEREKQAEELYNDVVSETGLKGNRSNGVVFKNYYVLRNTRMPAFLLENGFMDSTVDTPIILTNEHAELTAKGLEKFIVDMFDLKEKENPLLKDIPKWAYSTIKKLVDRELLKGDGNNLNLSNDMMRILVILDRAGCFEEK